MDKDERRAQKFLYFGVMMALIAADWIWYAQTFPHESPVWKLPFLPVIYAVWTGGTVFCFAAWLVLYRKAGKNQAMRRRHRRYQKKGTGK